MKVQLSINNLLTIRKNSYTTKKIVFGLNAIFLGIIFWSLILTIKSIVVVLYKSFQEKIYNESDLILLQHTITSIHSSILMAAIFLGILILIFRKVKIWHVGVSIFLGFNLNTYQFFDNVIHPFLFSIHLFDYFLRKGQTVINPQYSKIFFYLCIIVGLFIQNIIKKYRTVDRIFIQLILIVVLGTTFIFHIAIPMGIFKMAKKELENNLIHQVMVEDQKKLCQQKICFLLDSQLNLIKIETYSQHDINFFNNYKYFLQPAVFNMQFLNKKLYSISLGQINGFDYTIIVLKKTEEGFFLIYDTEAAKKLSKHSEIWVAFLSTMAHFFWFYGGLFLLFLHKEVMFRKLSPRLNKI